MSSYTGDIGGGTGSDANNNKYYSSNS